MRALLLATALALAADAGALELRLEAPEPWLRPGIPLRWRVQAHGPELHGPGQLEVALRRGDEVLALMREDLDDLGQLDLPWSGALFPPSAPAASAPTPVLQATIRRPSRLPGGLQVAVALCKLGDPALLERRRASLPAPADALQRLRQALIADLLTGRPRCGDCDRAAALLDGDPLAPPGIIPLAVVMPDDGSVQPAWLAVPAEPRQLVVALDDSSPDGPGRWRPVGITAAAGEQAVLACYPGGDHAWSSLAPHRIAAVIAAAQAMAPHLAGLPRLFVSATSARAAAEALALRHQGSWAAVGAMHPPWPTGSAPTPQARLPELPVYARGRFMLIVGSGEHARACADNARLAESFLVDWGRLAHGLPPLVTDRDFDPARWIGYHRVLIGNPRSNQVLGRMLDDGLRLGASWDHRLVTTADGRAWLRAERPAIAFANPGAACTVLDGRPAWPPGALPLLGMADATVREPESRSP